MILLKLKLPIFLSIVSGIVFLLPYIITPLFFTKTDQVFSGIPSGDYGIYASQIREIYEGKQFSVDSQLAEYKNNEPAFQILAPNLLGNITRFTGNFNSVFAIEAFLVGALLFLFSYLLMFEFTGSKIWSTAAGVVFITGYPIFIYISSGSFDLNSFLSNVFLIGGFPVNPMITSIPFGTLYALLQLVAIYYLYKSLTDSKKKYLVLATLFAGSLFYTTIYYWTAYFAGFGILFLIALFFKNKKIIIRMIGIAIFSVLLSLPFWVIYKSNSNLDAFKTFGLFHASYIEYIFSIRYFIASAAFFLIAKKKEITKEYFIISFILGGVLCLNVQLLTGFSVNPNHWPPRLEIFLMFFLVYLLFLINKRFNNKHLFKLRYKDIQLLPVAISALLTLYMVVYQVKYSQVGMRGQVISLKQNELFSWLNEKTPKDSVVLGLGVDTAYYITSQTHNNVFIPYLGFSFASWNEQVDRIATSYNLLGINGQKLSQEFDKPGWAGSHFVALYDFHKYYFMYDKNAYPDDVWSEIKKRDPVRYWYVRYIPYPERQKIMQKYFETSSLSKESLIKKFKLDYILIGPYDRDLGFGQENISKFSQKVFDNGKYQVFYVNKI